MGNPGRLSGTPWHVEYLKKKENDSKRHRRYCKYYDKKTERCWLKSIKCFGSMHCNNYKVDEKPKINSTQEKDKKEINYRLLVKFCRVGAKVEHKTFGKGVVTNVCDENITVSFESGKISKFDVKMVATNQLLKSI